MNQTPLDSGGRWSGTEDKQATVAFQWNAITARMHAGPGCDGNSGEASNFPGPKGDCLKADN